MFTLLNGVAGLGSIHFATKDALGKASMENLTISAWLIFVAMVCDMLDGRLARLSRRTTDFGAQLDSLCDMISFGAAPAILMLRAVIGFMAGNVERISFVPEVKYVERLVWCVAAAYLACAAIRLARFNVETEPEESAHLWFKGLPSPGAAAAVATLTLLFTDLVWQKSGWPSGAGPLLTVGVALPIVTLVTALLMVSTFQYPHIVNQYVRGKRPFDFLVRLIVVLMAIGMALVVAMYITAAALTVAYALSGPARHFWRRIHGKTEETPDHKDTRTESSEGNG